MSALLRFKVAPAAIGDVFNLGQGFVADPIGLGSAGWTVSFPLRLEANGEWPRDVCHGLQMLKHRMKAQISPCFEGYVVAMPDHPVRARNAHRALGALLRRIWPMSGMFCVEPYLRVVQHDRTGGVWQGTVQLMAWSSTVEASGRAGIDRGARHSLGLPSPFQLRPLIDL